MTDRKNKVHERWEFIEGTDHMYMISTEGRVLSLAQFNVHLLKPSLNGKGYYFVRIPINGKVRIKQVHRLVAEAFIPNPNNYPCVNHKDEISVNNSVDNLEWCTYEYNAVYSSYKLRKPTKKGTNTGEHHISIETSTGYFVVQYKIGEKHQKTKYVKKRFKTLADAVEYRDIALAQAGYL
jgi:hypothetical protein